TETIDTAAPSAAALLADMGALFQIRNSGAEARAATERVLRKREQDVLNWLAQGKSGCETAVILGISLCTVRVHIRNMLKKLDAANIPHAVTLAFQRGFLAL